MIKHRRLIISVTFVIFWSTGSLGFPHTVSLNTKFLQHKQTRVVIHHSVAIGKFAGTLFNVNFYGYLKLSLSIRFVVSNIKVLTLFSAVYQSTSVFLYF